MKAVNHKRLADILQEWSKGFKVVAPLKIDDNIRFKEWKEGSEVILNENSNIPPKEIFFPQTEEMYEYSIDKENVEIKEQVPTQEEFIVFGISPCDLKSLEMLDDLFLTKGFVDPYYKAKRDAAIIVAYLCDKPCRTCFCASMGINYQEAKGADIVIFKDGEELAFAAQSPKGEQLLGQVSPLLEEKELKLPAPEEFVLKADVEGLAEKLASMFEHSYWDTAYEKCLNCGACTYLCPTCHCFDINSHNRCKQGFKTRCWDTCMFADYTLMAGGHNPRPTRKERFRNRFLHKLQYFPERYEKTACVGCGRCIKKCPVNVDITAIIAQLKEVDLNG
ncbi:MAG: 4Fe-4S dicluster domain-containing protein [Bacillota bacterium]